MRGEFIGVWSELWREIWQPLLEEPLDEDGNVLADDIFCELYRDLAPALRARPSVEQLADIIDSPEQSRDAFLSVTSEDLASERAAVRFLESVHETLEEFQEAGDDAIMNRYFSLLADFIAKFSLRYDLRRPCEVCPSWAGLFSALVRSLDGIAAVDANVARQMEAFRESLQDLRLGPSEGRITNCVSKQVMLLEAIAAAGGNAGTDLGALCRAITDWPHPAVTQSLLNLYGFASDFPGVRHGTPSNGMARDVDMRDLVAMSVLLAGFTPYLSRNLDADVVFRGS